MYRFDQVEIDAARREIRRDGIEVRVEPQVLDVLLYLIEHRERVVPKIELLDSIWGTRFVSESALTSRIKLARRVCGDDGRAQRVIRTCVGRGYRFVAAMVGESDPRGAHLARAPERRARVIDDGRTQRRLPGRDEKMRALDEAFAVASNGACRIVFVSGPPGIGKTALVETFVDALDPEIAVLRGDCIERRRDAEPYFGLLTALSGFAAAERAHAVPLLERVAPLWLAQMPSLVDEGTASRLERAVLGATPQRMLREGVDAIAALAAERVVVLVLEDLHWSDADTLAVVEMLARQATGSLLVVATARAEPGAARDLIVRLATSGRAAHLVLEPLPRDALAELAPDWIGDARTIDDESVTALHRRSGGVPLFARELLAAWVRQERQRPDVSRGGSPARDDLLGRLPDNVRNLVELELAALAEHETRLLETAAVVGTRFEVAPIAAALVEENDAVDDTLHAMSSRLHYLEPVDAVRWPDGTVTTRYRFTHDLYRDVAESRVAPNRKMSLHHAIGIAVEGGHGEAIGDRCGELARHFLAAGDPTRAVAYLRRTGEQAVERNSYPTASRLLLEALGQLELMPPGEVRDRAELDVRMALGPALIVTRGWSGEAVLENYSRAIALCDRLGSDPDERASATYNLAQVTELRGLYETTDELLQPLVRDDGLGELHLEANELLACSTFHQGHFERALRHARRVLERYDPEAESATLARLAEHPISACNSWASLAAWFLGDADSSMVFAHAALETGERRLYALSTAQVQLAFLHQYRLEPEACLHWATLCSELADIQGFPFRAIQAELLAGWSRARLGDIDTGIACLERAMERYEASTARLGLPYLLALRADAHLLAGQAERALRHCEAAIGTLSTTTRSFFHEPELHRLRALAHQALGDDGEARSAWQRAERVAERLMSPPLRLRVALERYHHAGSDDERARLRALIGTLIERYRGQGDFPDLRAARRLYQKP